MVTGGAAMHLNDAIGRCPGLSYVCVHHEQAAAMAAQGYYRLTNRLAAVNVTAGPGATNAITGVFGAWTDSLGMVVVSGQVKWETLVRSTALPLRQLGDQEVDIVRLVEPITKYARGYRARLGPVPSGAGHSPGAYRPAGSSVAGHSWQRAVGDGGSRRPRRLHARARGARNGGRAGGARDDSRPAPARRAPGAPRGRGRTAGWGCGGVSPAGRTAADSSCHRVQRARPVPTDHRYYVGRQGTIGDRAGNFAVQNADFLLILGCRLNIRQVSYAWQHFARDAYKVMVDVDAAELAKPTLTIDLPVHADARAMIASLLEGTAGWEPLPAHAHWLAWCTERKARYPVVLPEYWTSPRLVNPYCFVQALFEGLADDDVVVTGDATACITTFQAGRSSRPASGSSRTRDARRWGSIFRRPSEPASRRAAAAWCASRATAASCSTSRSCRRSRGSGCRSRSSCSTTTAISRSG